MTPMVRARVLPLLLAAIVPAAAAGDAPPLQRPFETLLPWSLPRGQWELGWGLLRREGARPPFYADDPATVRDEWRLGVLDATLGLGGGGEAQVRFGVQRFHEAGGERRTGVEDARVAFTYQLPVETIATAVRFEVKLPNAPNDHRLGTDETDIFLIGAVGGRGARWGWAGNAGFGILGDPGEAAVQDDVLLLGAAFWRDLSREPGRATLLAEVNGLAASRFGNDFRYARAGVRLGRRIPVDLSVRFGLDALSEDRGAEVGLTFLPDRKPYQSRAD